VTISRNLPRILIGAISSGSGKTLLTCAILSYLKNTQRQVKCFKCGPDYIDPMFHKKTLGVQGGNLDTYFCDYESLTEICAKTVGDCAVIEGVMGLYDGLGGVELTGSSYDVAVATSTPIILVVDCHGQARTVLSVIKGILIDDAEHLIKGIILNRMPASLYDTVSPKIKDVITEINSDAILLGYVPKLKGINLESRHLGLKMPEEIDNIQEQIQIANDSLRATVDMNALIQIMEEASNLEYEASSASIQGDSLRLAVAMDEAFCFYYNENLEALAQMGAEIVPFSPLWDAALPENIQGLLLGGGYPELYLDILSKNESMKSSIRLAIDSGIPSLAECGGFMYLHNQIYDEDGKPYNMIGCVDGECTKKDRLVRFGYIELQSNKKAGYLDGMRGHEFHYYDSSNNGDEARATKPITQKSWNCMHIGVNYIWGFPHLYYQSNKELVRWFISCMKDYKKKTI